MLGNKLGEGLRTEWSWLLGGIGARKRVRELREEKKREVKQPKRNEDHKERRKQSERTSKGKKLQEATTSVSRKKPGCEVEETESKQAFHQWPQQLTWLIFLCNDRNAAAETFPSAGSFCRGQKQKRAYNE